MDQTDDSPIDAILRRHLAAELDPQRGRAAGQFAARGLRARRAAPIGVVHRGCGRCRVVGDHRAGEVTASWPRSRATCFGQSESGGGFDR